MTCFANFARINYFLVRPKFKILFFKSQFKIQFQIIFLKYFSIPDTENAESSNRSFKQLLKEIKNFFIARERKKVIGSIQVSGLWRKIVKVVLGTPINGIFK